MLFIPVGLVMSILFRSSWQLTEYQNPAISNINPNSDGCLNRFLQLQERSRDGARSRYMWRPATDLGRSSFSGCHSSAIVAASDMESPGYQEVFQPVPATPRPLTPPASKARDALSNLRSPESKTQTLFRIAQASLYHSSLHLSVILIDLRQKAGPVLPLSTNIFIQKTFSHSS